MYSTVYKGQKNSLAVHPIHGDTPQRRHFKTYCNKSPLLYSEDIKGEV